MTNLRISDQDFQRRVNRLQEEMKKKMLIYGWVIQVKVKPRYLCT